MEALLCNCAITCLGHPIRTLCTGFNFKSYQEGDICLVACMSDKRRVSLTSFKVLVVNLNVQDQLLVELS
jgi:hypothetical protein